MQFAYPWTSVIVKLALLSGKVSSALLWASVLNSGCYTGLMDEDIHVAIFSKERHQSAKEHLKPSK